VRAADWFSKPSSAVAPPQAAFVSRDANDALNALHAAVDRYSHDGADLEPVRRLVLQYCMHARQENIAPEQMLIRLKHALDGALSIVGDDPTAREEARTSIIGLAITAYYSDGDGDGASLSPTQ